MDEVPWNKIDIEDTHLTQGSFQEKKDSFILCPKVRDRLSPPVAFFIPLLFFLIEKTNVMNSKPMWSRIDFVPL